jgi:hypothetical protein
MRAVPGCCLKVRTWAYTTKYYTAISEALTSEGCAADSYRFGVRPGKLAGRFCREFGQEKNSRFLF